MRRKQPRRQERPADLRLPASFEIRRELSMRKRQLWLRIERGESVLSDIRASGLFSCRFLLAGARKLAVEPVRFHHCAYRLILGRHVSENRLDAITLPTDLPANRLTFDRQIISRQRAELFGLNLRLIDHVYGPTDLMGKTLNRQAR